MLNNPDVFIHPNPYFHDSVEVNWSAVPREYRGTIAFYTDVFYLLGQGSLGMSQELIVTYRADIEEYTRDQALEVRQRDALAAIDKLLIPDHKNALLARYPLDGTITRLPRRTYKEVAKLLDISEASAATRVIWGGMQDIRALSDVYPIGGLYTINGRSTLGNHRQARF